MKKILCLLLVFILAVPFVIAENPKVDGTECAPSSDPAQNVKSACGDGVGLPKEVGTIGPYLVQYECKKNPNGDNPVYTWQRKKSGSATWKQLLESSFPNLDWSKQPLKGFGALPAGAQLCIDAAGNECLTSRGASTTAERLAIATCVPAGGANDGAKCSCKPKETQSGKGGPDVGGQGGGAADQPNLALGITLIIGTLVGIGFMLEHSGRDRLLFSLTTLAVALIFIIGFVARPGMDTRYAVIEPLLETPTQGVYDANHETFITAKSGDKVVTQMNSEAGPPVTVTRHYVFSGSTQIATAEDIGLATISAAGPTPDPSQILVAGTSDEDPLQNILVTVAIDDGVATPVATASIGVQPTEVFQTIANGNLQTFITTPENTYVDTQSPNLPVTEFEATHELPPLNDIIQATPDTVVGITEDGTLGTVDLSTQAFAETDVEVTDIVRPQITAPELIAANPDYIPEDNILVVTENREAQFVNVVSQETTTLGQVASTSATLTEDGTVVSVSQDGYAYRATLDTAQEELKNYQRLSLASVSTVTLADPARLTQVAPTQLIATESGETTFNAYAQDAGTYQFEGILQPNSYYQVLTYATSAPITVQQAASLQPVDVRYFNNPYPYEMRADFSAHADLTTTYISIQFVRVSDAQSAEWVDITEASFAREGGSDVFAVQPQQTVVVNTVQQAYECSQDPSKICVNTYGTTYTSTQGGVQSSEIPLAYFNEQTGSWVSGGNVQFDIDPEDLSGTREGLEITPEDVLGGDTTAGQGGDTVALPGDELPPPCDREIDPCCEEDEVDLDQIWEELSVTMASTFPDRETFDDSVSVTGPCGNVVFKIPCEEYFSWNSPGDSIAGLVQAATGISPAVTKGGLAAGLLLAGEDVPIPLCETVDLTVGLSYRDSDGDGDRERAASVGLSINW